MLDIRRACAAMLTLSLVFLTGCGSASVPADVDPDTSPEAWETAEIFISYATSQKHQEKNLVALNESVLRESDGRIYCNTYTGEQMGDDDALLSAVQSGALSIVQMSTASQTQLVPELALLDTPHLFTSTEACNQLLNDELLDYFQPFYNREGLQLLAWNCARFRQLTSSFRVEGPSDLSQLDIRTLDSKYHQLYWSTLGAETQVIPFSDLFYAIQQGTINAQENPPDVLLDQGVFRFQPYLLLTDHVPFISCAVMNKECYDSLSPQDHEMLVRVFRELYNSSGGGISLAELSDSFRSVDTPSPALKEALLQAAGTVREALREDLGAETADAFYALVEAEASAEEADGSAS